MENAPIGNFPSMLFALTTEKSLWWEKKNGETEREGEKNTQLGRMKLQWPIAQHEFRRYLDNRQHFPSDKSIRLHLASIKRQIRKSIA